MVKIHEFLPQVLWKLYPNSESFLIVFQVSGHLLNTSAHAHSLPLGFHPPLQEPAGPGSHSVLQQRLRSVSQDWPFQVPQWGRNHQWGYPNNGWFRMVYIKDNPTKMGDDWG